MYNEKQVIQKYRLSKYLLVGVLCTQLIFAQNVNAQINDEDQGFVTSLRQQITEIKQTVNDLANLVANVITAKRVESIITPQLLTRNLQLGSSGEDVVALQIFLAQDRSLYPENIISGYYGPLTKEAVIRFQRKYNIEAVGEVGTQTREKINSLIGAEDQSASQLPNINANERAVERTANLVVPALFREPDVDVSYKIPDTTKLRPKRIAGTSRAVDIDFEALMADRISFSLDGTTEVTAVRDYTEEGYGNTFTWVGHLEGDVYSTVTFTKRGVTVAGVVTFDDKLFEILYLKDGVHIVREVDTTDEMPHADDSIQVPASADPSSSNDSNSDLVSSGGAQSTGEIIDVMVVYTPSARNSAGGTANMETHIINAIARANTAYANSEVAQRINLVHMREIAYTETGNLGTSLSDITGTSDGKMDEVHAWRNEYGADLVALISNDTSACGQGYLMNSSWLSSNFARYAFSVTRFSCISNDTFTHELGHNMGSAHNKESASSQGSYAYSYGHRQCGSFHTVMSYACSGSKRIMYFSNPSLTYNGTVIGITDQADNVRSLDNTASIVASFRGGAAEPAPSAPTELVANAVSSAQINLTWTDNATNETGYRIERSLDGTSWSTRATLGSNTTIFNDTGLTGATTYWYRVYAYNSTGNSANSNVVSATTEAPTVDTVAPTVSITEPKDGSAVPTRGNLTISSSASDDVGVVQITLYLNGKALTTCSNTTTCKTSTNPKKMSKGVNTITATARDAAGNETSDSITVTR